VIVAGSGILIRAASRCDVDAVAGLAGELAQSFAFSAAKFGVNFPELLAVTSAGLPCPYRQGSPLRVMNRQIHAER